MTTPKSKWKGKYKNLDRTAAKASHQKRENDRYQFRCKAVRLFDRYGKEIAEDLDVSTRSLYRWRRRVHDYGLEGLMMAFLLTVALIFIGIWSPHLSIILALLGLVASVILGLLEIGFGMMISLVIIGIIILWRLNK